MSHFGEDEPLRRSSKSTEEAQGMSHLAEAKKDKEYQRVKESPQSGNAEGAQDAHDEPLREAQQLCVELVSNMSSGCGCD
jgi:hypothetical protein